MREQLLNVFEALGEGRERRRTEAEGRLWRWQSCMVLLVPSLLIPLWITKVHQIEDEAKIITHHVHQGLLSRTDETATLLSQLNQSVVYLGTILKSSVLNQTDIQFSSIQTQVAPLLFQALLTIPHIYEVSYIAIDGLFFSFYMKENRPFAVYSNSSSPFFLNSTVNYTLYTQPAYQDSGKLYGEATKASVSSINIARCFQEAVKRGNVYSTLGIGWDSDQELVLLNNIAIERRAAVSIGFQVKPLIRFLTSGLDAYDGSLYLAANAGTMLSSGIQNTRIVVTGNNGSSIQLFNTERDKMNFVGNISCQPNEGIQRSEVLEVEKTKYVFYCSSIDFIGLPSVYVLALPYKGLDSSISHNIGYASVLLILTMAAMAFAIFAFAFAVVGFARREMHLCTALITQMEATQQAERKSMNKSVALSSASHDIRTSLAGIIGLIEMCHEQVVPRSEMQMNLLQAQVCAKDLTGILNSILDASKIEAGKMQLEEEEFDLEQLLEDAVDLFHPIGMKKGVDVLLDPHDGSIRKCSSIKGDRGKLKQILSNLLSNAVKFTSEGHVSVKVTAQKTSFPNAILTPKWNKSVTCTPCFVLPSEGSYSNLEVANNFQQNGDLMEFIFEVNDTGKGIPKEKHKTVFENYIQVKDSALGQEGTGLGLGIVQSLVRLMGGEIAIIDKEFGEKGTCFRFNSVLTICANQNRGLTREVDIESSSVASTQSRIPKPEGSQAILFVTSNARSKMLQKYMESQGIKVHVVSQYEQLAQTLKVIKENTVISSNRCKRVASGSSRIHGHSRPLSRPNELNFNSIEETSDLAYSRRRIRSMSKQNFFLIVIDTSGGPFREISRAVAEFRRDMVSVLTRVVWIDRPGTRSLHFQGLDADKLPPTDLIFTKPLHGSRLHQLIRLLPEFGGNIMAHRTKREFISSKAPLLSRSRHRSSENVDTKDRTAQEIDVEGKNKPFAGKKVLVAEDNVVLRKLAAAVVSRLGAETFPCQNGEEAVQLVCRQMFEQRKQGVDGILPFAYILMDCEMPIMDGYEATKRIREEEKHFGVHMPIIALTAHAADEERNKMTEVGMDYYLSKPLKEESLLKILFQINQE